MVLKKWWSNKIFRGDVWLLVHSIGLVAFLNLVENGFSITSMILCFVGWYGHSRLMDLIEYGT